MKRAFNLVICRLRAVWGVLTARRCVVVTYDPRQPVNRLGEVYLCGPCQEMPGRLAAATAITLHWDSLDSTEGQQAALELGRKLFDQAAQRAESKSSGKQKRGARDSE